MYNKSRQQLLIKIHDFPPPLPTQCPTHMLRDRRRSQTILSPLSTSFSSNLAPICLSSRTLNTRKICHRPTWEQKPLGGNRGPQQKWPPSNELRAALSPKGQSFPDFKLPLWHELKTSEITLGSGGDRRVHKGSTGGGRDAPKLNELQICPTHKTVISL